jgi:hypothetical protein
MAVSLSILILLDPTNSALTDISKSIALYLHDEQSLYRVLAIDLCSRGFHIWQHYIDAMEILRALFTLATSSRKESISAQNAGPQARLAVLQIASNNTALFMTTLALDILNPLGVDHRKSVMQIVAFLIRKVCTTIIFCLSLTRHPAAIGALPQSSSAYGSCREVLGSQRYCSQRCNPGHGYRDHRPCSENVCISFHFDLDF